MEEVIYEISKLRLASLDGEWVQAVYFSEFLEFGDFPAEYESVLDNLDKSTVIKDIMKSLDTWINTEETAPNEDKSWTTLSNLVPYEKLLAILAYFIDCGGKNVTAREDRNNALLASKLYFKLMSIPGYRAYHIYHSQLFAQSLTCLSYPKALCEAENYFTSRELTIEVNSLLKDLTEFIIALKAVMEHLQLRPSDMNFEDILSNLVDVTGGALVNKLNVDKVALANIHTMIYEIIDGLVCDDDERPDEVAIKLLFKCLLPKLLAVSVDNRSGNVLVRASYVTYSGFLVSKYGKAALSGYTILLEHLCYALDGLERAEVRTARTSLVAGLMSLLPQKSYQKFVQWLLKLSTTAKIPHRQIALEMLGNLLNNVDLIHDEWFPEQSNDAQNSDNQDANFIRNKLLVDSGVDEAIDLQDFTISTEDESSQESSEAIINVEEEEVLLRARTLRVSHVVILRAVCERACDGSSVVRARALHLLTDCLGNTRPSIRQAINELNGTGEVSRLMALGARCMCDERAVVRRAAVGLVYRLLAASCSPSTNDLGVLVGLCRDASIIVRSAAISAMGELVMANPTDTMFDAFLAGPMSQLSDPENKIQEQVVTLMKQLLLDKLERANVNEEPHPWRLLAAITRHNKRSHLQKACTVLAKSANCINHRIVDTLSTHLSGDGDRALYCLVLLTSVARLVDYSDMRFVIDYFYVITHLEECEVRVMSLTLELLSLWSRFVPPTDRVLLRDFLVQRLAIHPDAGNRLLCVKLAAQLDANNIQWATELMQISERRAVDEVSVEELLRTADLALVAPRRPSAALLRTFLAAMAQPPPEWEDRSMGMCAAAVGRLCLRSREFATQAAPTLAALLPDDAVPLCARINSLLALTDICIRYPSIVDVELGSVCGCLRARSPSPLRRVAARAITRLLLAGFLRLRVPLYYQFCALLADEDHDVREPAEYYVTSCLSPDAIYHHFVDCVIYYNKSNTELDSELSFDGRQLIYDVMLQRLSLVQKLNVQCRLAREVVSHAADVADEQPLADELPAPLHAALLDAIIILCSPRMKLAKKPPGSGEADLEDIHERVTTNIVSHKMKVTVAEVVVPAVLRLYGQQRPRGGQLAAYLVRIATDLLNDYRLEIEELFENNEDLVERVSQFQSTIGLEPVAGNARNLVTTSTALDPATPHAAPRRRTARQARRAALPRRALHF